MYSYSLKNDAWFQPLERVNNTDSTSHQDYFGSYRDQALISYSDSRLVPAPNGKKCVLCAGPLIRAVESGGWFLSDEFNLAQPDTMSALAPLRWLWKHY